VLDEQIAEGKATLERDGVTVDDIQVLHTADMQFQGQSHLLTVAIEDKAITRDALQKAFEAAYWQRFEVELPEIRAVLVNLHTAVIGRRPDLSLDRLLAAEPAKDVAGAMKKSRKVWYDVGGWQDTPVYDRERLPRGTSFSGPAILEQLDTTVVIEPGNRVAIDGLGNLIVSVNGE
jgi:N-methylhydantoinase A